MSIRNRPAYEAGLLLDERHRPGSVTERRSRVGEPHVVDLNDLAREVAGATGQQVPLADPAGGGRQARVLVLLEEHIPCRTAGTGLISLHANDPTAGNTMAACQRAGLDYGDTLLWHVIPWWTQDPSTACGRRPSRVAEAGTAAPYLARLLDLLPRVQAVVLLGARTQQAWRRALATAGLDLPRHLRVLPAPHTSPMAWNMTGRDGVPHREQTVTALGEALAAGAAPSRSALRRSPSWKP